MECCGKAAAFVLRIRSERSAIWHAFARLPNVLCRFTSRFARSVWKTERLFRLRCRLVDSDRQWSHALSDLELDASGIHLGIFATQRRRFACG